MPRIGSIRINLSAGTAELDADFKRAYATVSDFDRKVRGAAGGLRTLADSAKATRGEIRESNGTLALLSEQLGVHVPRHIRTFISSMPGVASALSKAFSGVAVIGLIMVLVEGIKKLAEFREAIKKAQDAPQRLAQGFRELNAPLKLANDELDLTNAKLENEIAKLSGKPQNSLKEALYEARVEADKLADSLDKAFKELNEFLSKNEIGFWKSLIGNARTDALTEEFGGKDKYIGAGFPGRIQKITEQAQEDLDAVKTGGSKAEQKAANDQKNAISARTRNQLEKEFGDELKKVNSQLREAQRLQDLRIHPPATSGSFSPYIATAPAPGQTSPDQGQRIQDLAAIHHRLVLQQHSVESRFENQADIATLEPLKEAGRRIDPFGNEIAKLDAELRGVNQELVAAGKSEAAKVQAKSWAEFQKIVEEVNKSLTDEKKKKLTGDVDETKLTATGQKGDILKRLNDIGRIKDETAFTNEFAKGNAAIRERIDLQKLLTAAVGNGYEAIRAATVHGKVVQDFGGAEKYEEALKTHPAQVAERTTLAGSEYDAQRGDALANTVDKLQDQVALEKSLAVAQQQGAEAVRLTTLAYKLHEITVDGARDAQGHLTDAVRKQIQAEFDLYKAQRLNKSSGRVAKLDEEIAAVKQLTAAELQGAEATRQAQLATKYGGMQKAGASPEEIQKTRTLDDLTHQREITTEALKTGLAYQNQLESIDAQIAKLHQIQAIQGDTLAIEISLKKLTEERTKIMSEQVAVLGSARDGLYAFFQQMAADGKSAAADIHDALSHTFTSLNDELAKIMTGQKANWKSFFNGISEQLAKMALQRLESNIAGMIFGNGQPIPSVPGTGKTPIMTDPFGIPLPSAPVPATSQPAHTGLRGLFDKLLGANKQPLRTRDGSTPANGLFVIPVGMNGVAPSSIPGGPATALPGPSVNPDLRPPWQPINNGPAGSPSGDVNGPPSIMLRPNATGSIDDVVPSGVGDSSRIPISQDSDALARARWGIPKGAVLIPNASGTLEYGSPPKPSVTSGLSYPPSENVSSEIQYAQPLRVPDAAVSQPMPWGVNMLSPLPQPPPYQGYAAGGDVAADTPIIVGEKGQELFVPESAGKIVPNHKLAQFQHFADGSDLSDLFPDFATGKAYVDAPSRGTKGRGLFSDLDQDGQTDSTPLFVALTNQGVAEAVPVVPAKLANEASAVQRPIFPDPSAKPASIYAPSNSSGTNSQNAFGSLASVAGPGLGQLSNTPGLDSGAALGLQAAGMAVTVLGALFGSSDAGSHDNTPGDPFLGDPDSPSGGNDNGMGRGLPGGAPLDGAAMSLVSSVIGLFNKTGGAPTSGKQGSSAGNPLYVKDVGGSSGGSSGGMGGGLGSLLGMFGGGGGGAGLSASAGADAFSLGDAADLGLAAMASGGEARGNKTILVGERGPELFTPKMHGTIIPNHKLSSLGRLFGGFRAEGGDVSPSQAYMVGEQGPEAMRSVVNNASSSTVGARNVNAPGGNVYYSIDARGTDPMLTEKRVQASLQAVHGSAVQASFASQQEHQKRTPQT